MALVLCTGVDAILMETRRLILEGAGHTVIAAQDQNAVRTACEKYCFDVAVIGQAATPRAKTDIAAAIREHCPSAKILELYPTHHTRTLQNADAWLAVPADVPYAIAERVTELARKRNGN